MKKQLILPETVINEMKKENSNVIPFEQPRPQPDGKEPPSSDWLGGLPPGTIFLTRPKGKSVIDLMEFHVVYQLPKSTYLMFRNPENQDQEIYRYVDTLLFSHHMDFFEIVTEGKDE